MACRVAVSRTNVSGGRRATCEHANTITELGFCAACRRGSVPCVRVGPQCRAAPNQVHRCPATDAACRDAGAAQALAHALPPTSPPPSLPPPRPCPPPPLSSAPRGRDRWLRRSCTQPTSFPPPTKQRLGRPALHTCIPRNFPSIAADNGSSVDKLMRTSRELPASVTHTPATAATQP